MNNSIQKVKDKFHLLIDQVEDETMLNEYIILFENELGLKGDWYQALPDQVQHKINQSLKDINTNAIYSLEEIKSKYGN